MDAREVLQQFLEALVGVDLTQPLPRQFWAAEYRRLSQRISHVDREKQTPDDKILTLVRGRLLATPGATPQMYEQMRLGIQHYLDGAITPGEFRTLLIRSGFRLIPPPVSTIDIH